MRIIFIIVAALLVAHEFGSNPTPPKPTPVIVWTKPDGSGVLIKKRRKSPQKKSGVREFMHSIGRMESKNNYKATNSLGMLGKYQFSPRTIRAMGFRVNADSFLNDPSLQDRVMLAFMRDNKRSLRSVIKKYDGKTVNGVFITTSGILAAAHLAGVGGVLAFFYPDKYHYKTTDMNGASVAMYLNKFRHYNVEDL